MHDCIRIYKCPHIRNAKMQKCPIGIFDVLCSVDVQVGNVYDAISTCALQTRQYVI